MIFQRPSVVSLKTRVAFTIFKLAFHGEKQHTHHKLINENYYA